MKVQSSFLMNFFQLQMMWDMNWRPVLQIVKTSLNPQCCFLYNETWNDNKWIILHNTLTPKNNSVRDEFIISADDSEDAPENPILLFMENDKQNKKEKCIVNISVIEVRDELTFSNSDNEHAPESPILFQSIQN